MWVVEYTAGFKYLDQVTLKYETRWRLLALVRYTAYYYRYLFSLYPVKFLSIHRHRGNVIDLPKRRISK